MFDYSEYYLKNFSLSILILSFVLFVLILSAIGWYRERKKPMKWHKVLRIVLFYAVILVFFTDAGAHLFRGGFWLPFEKETDAVEVTGVIEKTSDPFIHRGDYPYRNNECGGYVYIHGVRYHVMTYADLQVGDEVTLLVLPKSRFVLEIRLAKTVTVEAHETRFLPLDSLCVFGLFDNERTRVRFQKVSV